jgi:hypothetical protein
MPRSDAPGESSYRSYNEVERDILRTLGFEELGLYFVLKEYANFYTGSFGTFNNQKMTYARLAREMQREASQGRPAKEFDTTAIKRLLERLTEVGLVADVQWDGRRLTMLLPHSPIWKDNPARREGAGGGEAAGKLPRHSTAQNAAKPVAARDSAAPASTPSLVGSKEVNRPFFNTGTSATGHGETVAGDPERTRRPAPQVADSPADAWDMDDDWLAERSEFFARRSASGSASMTLPAIETLLAAAGTVLYPHLPASRAIYTSWVRKGLTRGRLEGALAMAGDDAVTPRDLDALLYPKPAGRQFQAAVRRRGGVAL